MNMRRVSFVIALVIVMFAGCCMAPVQAADVQFKADDPYICKEKHHVRP